MRAPSPAEYLLDLNCELAQYTTPTGALAMRDLLGYELLYNAHEMALDITQDPPSQPNPPRHMLTAKTLQLAAHPRGVRDESDGDLISDMCCFQAELRLVRSIAYHRKGARPFSDHVPAAVHFDIDGEPFGYQKASGKQTVYAWRDAEVDTEAGVRWIPADSFLRPVYDEDFSLQAYLGEGLVGIHVLPQRYDFVRFSNAGLPRHVRRLVAQDVSAGNGLDKLQANLNEAIKFKPRTIGKHVCALLRQQKIATIEKLSL